MSAMNSGQPAEIGGQVRRARKAHEWTQEELAERAGVAPGTVTRVENGMPVRPGNLKAVLDALDLSLVDQDSAEDTETPLVLDLVTKTLRAIPEGQERRRAANEIIRFITITRLSG